MQKPSKKCTQKEKGKFIESRNWIPRQTQENISFGFPSASCSLENNVDASRSKAHTKSHFQLRNGVKNIGKLFISQTFAFDFVRHFFHGTRASTNTSDFEIKSKINKQQISSGNILGILGEVSSLVNARNKNYWMVHFYLKVVVSWMQRFKS